jgi:hypothetical protein
MSHRCNLPLRSTTLAAILVACALAELTTAPPAAQAQIPVANLAWGGARVLGAMVRRSQTYTAAAQTQRDFNRYYDRLQDTARTQLASGELSSLRNTQAGLQHVRMGAYIKVYEATDAEHRAVTRAIEAEKNEARRNFNRTVVREITSAVIRLPGAQQILTDVRGTIANLRAAVIALQSAIAAGRPFDQLREALANQVRDSAYMQDHVRYLGTLLGQDLDRAMGGALTRVDQALQRAQEEMAAAATGLDQIDAQVAALSIDSANVAPGDQTGSGSTIRATDGLNAALDAASNAIAFFGLIQDSRGTTRNEMYQEIRSQMQQEHNVELLNAAMTVRLVTCTGVGRGEYVTAMGMLGRTPGTVPDPEDARYVVCTERQSGQPVSAYIVGGGVEPTATTDERTPTAEAVIPVGTYVGTTTYPDTLTPENVGTVSENKITVTVDPHGIVTGSMLVVRDKSEVITNSCTVAYHHEYAGELSGRLGGSEGQVNIRLQRTGTSGHCDSSAEPWADPPSDWLVSIQVIEGVMTGEVVGFEGSQDSAFAFTAERQ